jgi:hemolysin activation/secretion protein
MGVPNPKRQTWLYHALLLSSALAAGLQAQAQEETNRGERGITVRPASPDAQSGTDTMTPTGTDQVDAILPPLSEQTPVVTLGPDARITISRIELEGNTVLPASEIAALTERARASAITAADIHQLRYQLASLYHQHGYVAATVTLPDQRVDSGVIRLRAFEGELADIRIQGNHTLRDNYLRSRIDDAVESPLNVADLQSSLRRLQSDPRIRQVNANLLPGPQAGETDLQIDIVENPNYWVRTSVDNYRSPSVDELRALLSAGNLNFTGFGDILSVNFGVTEGLDDLDVSYSIPLTAADTRLSAYYRSTDSNIVEEPFDLIDIESQSSTYGLALSSPFRSDSGRVITTTLGIENRHAENRLLGMPFSLTPGEQDGKSEVSAAYLRAEGVWQGDDQVLGVSIAGRFGIDWFDPTVNEFGPDSSFLSFQFQLQHARAIRWRNGQLVLRGAAQYTPDSLLALEKFSAGGHSTVRGYRENQLVRDRGLVASAELQFPLFVDDDGNDRAGVHLVPFVDYGTARDNDKSLASSRRDELFSAGLGLRWRPWADWYVAIDYAEALNEVPSQNDSLQERGIHFRIEYRVAPGS